MGDDTDSDSWYGVPEPSGLGDPHEPTVLTGDDYVVPADVPEGERTPELDGDRIREDLETVVGFSVASRERGVRRWGRIAGRPALTETIEWVAERFRDAGLDRVEVQTFDSTEPVWRPIDWEVTLRGADGSAVRLESALPVRGSPTLPPGGVTAPLVYVGTARPAELHGVGVDGKVAVQHLSNEGAPFYVRNRGSEGIERLVDRGAAGVLSVIESPGNVHVQLFDGIETAPSFNLGGEDGAFLEEVMDRAVADGTLEDLRIRMELETEVRNDLTAENAVGVVPGRATAGENVVVNAHADAWFDGASDNADGVAVQLALARHFAKPENRLDRTLVFVATAGHHVDGLYGPERFVELNPDVTDDTVLVLNLEHVAQKNLTPSYEGPTGERFRGGVFEGRGFRQLETTTASQPSSFGIDDGGSFLEDVVREGTARYRLHISERADDFASGEALGYADVDAPRVGPVRSGPLYHTSGDVPETISTPGLERVAHFFRFFLEEVDAASTEELYA